jgi:hypothetical protein
MEWAACFSTCDLEKNNLKTLGQTNFNNYKINTFSKHYFGSMYNVVKIEARKN